MRLLLSSYPRLDARLPDISVPHFFPNDVSSESMREFAYRWEWTLRSSPESLWPLVADTNRFNRDAGLPPVERLPGGEPQPRLRITFLGTHVEWDEYPFEWVRPHYYRVLRRFHSGPVAEILASAELTPLPEGGTRLVYSLRATPRTFLGRVVIPLKIGRQTRRKFEEVFRRYDETAAAGRTFWDAARLAPKGEIRLLGLRDALLGAGSPREQVDRLVQFLLQSDDWTLTRLRPYALADVWKSPRREILELCLRATKVGLLDSRWELLCPFCRGAKQSHGSLEAIENRVHCDACRIDFRAEFDRSVEITFRPNPSVRPVEGPEFCIGGPEITPHVVAQQRIPPKEEREIELRLDPGEYRIRASGLPGLRPLRVTPEGWEEIDCTLGGEEAPLQVTPQFLLRIANPTEVERLVAVERTAWSDKVATAAEVTSLQLFRDLFGRETLRPGEQIAVGSLTLLFTDLRGSTRLYREIGDASAFGRVMSHFEALRSAVAEEDGSIVKTMGDATMAVFPRPVCGVRAALRALRNVHPLEIKAGLHTGPCIAVGSNDRLDYFGTTVNVASRLEELSTGGDLVVSSAVQTDPEVAELLRREGHEVEPFEPVLRGLDPERFPASRIRPRIV